MSGLPGPSPYLRQREQAYRVRPTGAFIRFEKEEIEQSIPQRFEQQVGRYPDRLAVKTRNHQLTYAALNQAADGVARAILAQRDGGEEPIALLLEHDAPLVAAILGVLKAGKMYVPLDPSYPHARNAYILEDSRAGLIVTNNRHLSLVSELDRHERQLVNSDEIDPALFTEDLDLHIPPDTLAYILYTSGSTRQPKGVVQTHRNVLHDIWQYTNTLLICSDDRMTLLYSCSVNGAVRGIFGALLNGATLYPMNVREEGLANLADLLIREEITFYHSVPTVFRQFVATLTGEEKFPRLRLIRFGGERVLAQDVELYKKHFSDDCILYTGMGATETGHVRQYFIDKGTQIPGSVVPTGYAVEGKEVLLLGDDGEEVGFDRVGEIAIRSCYLSPGYWQKPDLTRAAFLPDPAGGNARIYRTGDLGRMRPDGCLEHMGRKDFQVKVRGYRVEVAEIETALLNLAGITEAVVMALESELGETRLVAYVVPEQPSNAPTISELRRLLSEKLPQHMVPQSFVVLGKMPLTPNGKVDRRALPAPDTDRPALEEAFVAPRTPVEEALAGIWEAVLEIERVGVHDDFLELGGHSLLAVQMVTWLNRHFGVELPLRALFEASTVAGLALAVTQIRAEAEIDIEQMLDQVEQMQVRQVSQEFSERAINDRARRIANLSPEQRRLLELMLQERVQVRADEGIPALPRYSESGQPRVFPLSSAQRWMWFNEQPPSGVHNMSPQAMRLRGPLDVAALEESLNEICSRHEALRTTFGTRDGEPVQIVSPPQPVTLTCLEGV